MFVVMVLVTESNDVRVDPSVLIHSTSISNKDVPTAFFVGDATLFDKVMARKLPVSTTGLTYGLRDVSCI